MIQNGEVVYFKKMQNSTHRRANAIEVKGFSFGILLGYLPQFAKEPSAHHLMMLMGQNGFITFDDVAEFLGEEQARLCVQKYEDKYYGKEIVPTEPVAEESSIIGEDGKPLMIARGESDASR